MDFPAARAYANKHASQVLVATCGTEIVEETYADGFSLDSPHALYSGTKSFWGVAAIAAQGGGLLQLDEPVAQTIAAWGADPLKRRVTLRMLLTLTAGFGFGGLGKAVPTYDRALAMPLKHEPATTFSYGGIALQVFGAVLARKLAPYRCTPARYLHERILDPAGVTIASWRVLGDGSQPLPTGISMTARNWLAYGRYVLAQYAALSECFCGSAVNRRYGLGWWLEPAGAPADIAYASGAGGQALYLVPSLDLAIVRFGRSASFKHEAFLKRLFSPAGGDSSGQNGIGAFERGNPRSLEL